jgi:hypothetical protein
MLTWKQKKFGRSNLCDYCWVENFQFLYLTKKQNLRWIIALKTASSDLGN